MGDRLVTIARYGDSLEANLAKQLLDGHGIKSVVTGEHAANVYSGLLPLVAIELQVFESQAEEAQRILEPQEQEEEQCPDTE
ncbi:MAG: putative signal transducing protein [Planctomycetota bacterium]|jgi:hypothetical protein